MEVNYTYEELKRERTATLIGSLILELAWQDKITVHKDMTMTEKLNHYEAADIFIDKLSGMEDEDYKKFVDRPSRYDNGYIKINFWRKLMWT